MTTRCINASRHEANSLHEGRATAIVRRMEPQPPSGTEGFEWVWGAIDGCGGWLPLSWPDGFHPKPTGPPIRFARRGDVLSIEGRDFRIASIEPIRVFEMTEDQAKACGVDAIPYKTIAPMGGEIHHDGYAYAMSQLYESLHGEGSWLRDWAWLIGLRRIEE